MASRVDIIIAAKNQASAALKQVNNDLNRLDDTAGRLSGAGGLAGILGIAGGAGAVALLSKAAIETSRLATEIARTEQAFIMLAGGTGEARSRLEAMRRATGGAVDDLTAMQLANRAAALGFADTTAELERTTKLASTISRVMGGDVATVLENIQAAASNLSFVRLDQMGISADGVRQKYDALREANSSLSKEAAFLEATLSIGESTFGELGESGVGAASGLEELTTSLTNLKNELLASGSILDGFFGTMADGIQSFRDSEVSALAQNLTDISNELAKGVSTEQQERLLDLYGKINDRLNELGYTVVNVNGEFQAVKSEMDSTAGSAENLDAAENQLSSTTQRLGNDFISVTGGLSHFNANLQTTAGNVMTLTSVMSGFTGQINSIASGMVANLGAQGALGYAEDLTDEARTQAYQWMQAGIPLEQIQGILLPAMLSDVRKANSEIYTTGKGVSAVNSEFNSLKSTISGIVSGAIGPVAGVNAEDFLPREDEVNENARRLADIMVNGLKGQEWLDEFKSEVPGIWAEIESSGDPQGAAARILKDFQDGLRPELIDKERAKEIAKRALIGDKNTKALVDEIAGELAQEMGVSFAQAQAAASSAFGGGGGSGGSGASTATIKPKIDLSSIDATTIGTQLNSALSGITLTPAIAFEPELPENMGTTFATLITSTIASGDVATAYGSIGSGVIGPLILTGIKNATVPGDVGVGFATSVTSAIASGENATLYSSIGSGIIGPLIMTGVAGATVPGNIGTTFATSLTAAIASGENATLYSAIGSGIIGPLIATGVGAVDPQLLEAPAGKFVSTFMNSIRAGFVTAETSGGDNMMGQLGNMWAGMFALSITSSSIGADVAGAIHQQIAASVSLIESSGTNAGQNWRKGFMNEVMQIPADTLNTLAMLVVPYVNAAINAQGGRTEAGGG